MVETVTRPNYVETFLGNMSSISELVLGDVKFFFAETFV